jgi:hypothetical protein
MDFSPYYSMQPDTKLVLSVIAKPAEKLYMIAIASVRSIYQENNHETKETKTLCT